MADILSVLGAGTMGAGIAHVAALAGIDVRLYDADPAARERGLRRIEQNLDAGVARGKVAAEARDAALARIATAESLAVAIADATIVVEAVYEDVALKRRVFADVDAAAPAGALLVTNTSSLSVAAIAAATRRPEA